MNITYGWATRLGVLIVASVAVCQATSGQFARAQQGSAPPFFQERVVWQYKEDGHWPHHVYGLTVTKQGTILAFTEARLAPKDADPHHLVLKRSADKGQTWSDDIYIERADGEWWRANGQPGKLECWLNAAALVDQKSGRVFFFYALNEGSQDQKWTRVFYRYSDDDGRTWLPTKQQGGRVEVTSLFSDGRHNWTFHMPGPGHGIQLRRQRGANARHNGRLLLQFWHRGPLFATPRNYGVSVIYSDDGGKTWQHGGNAGIGDGMNESRLVELDDGRILLNARGATTDNAGAKIDTSVNRLFAYSQDAGASFSAPVLRRELSFFRTDAGLIDYPLAPTRSALLLSYPNDLNERSRLTVSASLDGGQSWAVSRMIYAGGGCYSDLVILPDKSIGLLYGKDRPETPVHTSRGVTPNVWLPREVVFVRFNYEWLRAGK